MGHQFRKSKKVGPLRVTATKNGLSFSTGVGPLRYSINTHGDKYMTTRIPGTGVYKREKLATKKPEESTPHSHPTESLDGTMKKFTALDYTAIAEDDNIRFIDKNGSEVLVPYGAISYVMWNPDLKSIGKGKEPITYIGFTYNCKKQNRIPLKLQAGSSHAKATAANMEFVDYVKDKISDVMPIMDWMQDIDPAMVKKAKRRENMKYIVGGIILIVLVVFSATKCANSGKVTLDENAQKTDVIGLVVPEKMKEGRQDRISPENTVAIMQWEGKGVDKNDLAKWLKAHNPVEEKATLNRRPLEPCPTVRNDTYISYSWASGKSLYGTFYQVNLTATNGMAEIEVNASVPKRCS